MGRKKAHTMLYRGFKIKISPVRIDVGYPVYYEYQIFTKGGRDLYLEGGHPSNRTREEGFKQGKEMIDAMYARPEMFGETVQRIVKRNWRYR